MNIEQIDTFKRNISANCKHTRATDEPSNETSKKISFSQKFKQLKINI